MNVSTKRARETLDLIQRSPVDFVEKLLVNDDGSPAIPHPGQRELLEGIRRITVAACGRQWGKSTALGWFIVWWAITHKARKVYIIAPSLDQSRIIFNEVARHFKSDTLSGQLVGKIVITHFPRSSSGMGPKFTVGAPIPRSTSVVRPLTWSCATKRRS